MQNETHLAQGSESVSGFYESYTETQRYILAIETRKTRNILFTLAAITFAGDFLTLLRWDVLMLAPVLVILIVPVILAGLAFFALKEPLTAIIIAAIILIGLWVYAMVITNGRAAIMGWLIRAVIIYFLIAGYQHAKEAHRIKKELRN